MVLLTGPDHKWASKTAHQAKNANRTLRPYLFTAQNKNKNQKHTSTPPQSGAFRVSTPEGNYFNKLI